MTPQTLKQAITRYRQNGGDRGYAFSYSMYAPLQVEFCEDFSKIILLQDGDDNDLVARLYDCEPDAIDKALELMRVAVPCPECRVDNKRYGHGLVACRGCGRIYDV